jgi:alkylation response protein AidB-like acyl-CoA dehydrogenase
MDLDLSDDQVALRDGIASMLEGRFGSDRIRTGFDRAMFDELAAAGVFSLRADGFGWADCVVVFEQLGRYCVPGPLVGSLLFGAGRVTGVVEDAAPAWIEYLDALDDLVVLSGPDARRIDASALSGEPSTWPLDPLTPVTRVDSLPAGNTINADAAERRREGATLTAAFQLGLADRCTELAVAYAKERVQFDRPIAAFQAIKHLCADMLVRTEVARAAVYAAGAHLDDVDLASYADLDRGISGAKVMAGEAAIANGKAATQVFGGMGFTWEVDVHLYLKRAWLLDRHFGSADTHADVVAAALGVGS